MVLRKNAADKAKKLICIVYAIIRNTDETNLVIKFEHMLCALVKIYDIAENILYFTVDLIQ